MNEHEKGQVAVNAARIYEHFFVPALFGEWPPRVLRAANVQPGQAVLDVACGTGILAREAAAVVGANGSVVGLDINEGMLAVAREQAPNIVWQVGPAEALPFAAHSFDRVVSQFALMFFADQVKALTEIRRVLRSGGIMTIAVWDSLAATPGYAAVAEMLDTLFGATVAQSIQAPYSLGDVDKLRALFTEAGMDDITIQTISGQARFPSIDAWVYTDIKGWTLADKIDDEGFEQLRQYASKKLARFARPDGSVAFDAPAHLVTLTKTA